MATLWDCGWKCEGSPDTRDSSHEPPSPHTATEIDRETVTQTDRQKVIQVHRTAGMSLTDINTDNVCVYGVVSTNHLLYTLWQKQTDRQRDIHTDRQADTETDRQTDRRFSRHTGQFAWTTFSTHCDRNRQADIETDRQKNRRAAYRKKILQTYRTVGISYLNQSINNEWINNWMNQSRARILKSFQTVMILLLTENVFCVVKPNE